LPQEVEEFTTVLRVKLLEDFPNQDRAIKDLTESYRNTIISIAQAFSRGEALNEIQTGIVLSGAPNSGQNQLVKRFAELIYGDQVSKKVYEVMGAPMSPTRGGIESLGSQQNSVGENPAGKHWGIAPPYVGSDKPGLLVEKIKSGELGIVIFSDVQNFPSSVWPHVNEMIEKKKTTDLRNDKAFPTNFIFFILTHSDGNHELAGSNQQEAMSRQELANELSSVGADNIRTLMTRNSDNLDPSAAGYLNFTLLTPHTKESAQVLGMKTAADRARRYEENFGISVQIDEELIKFLVESEFFPFESSFMFSII